jgi:frataxin-like iron-binding protein CyaY
LVDERLVGLRDHVIDLVRRELEAFEERVAERLNLDERVVRSTAKAIAAAEVTKLHNIVMEEFNEFKAKVEEELNKRGVDAETIRQVVNEEFSRVINELDRRFMHVLSAIDEQANDIRDAMDLINEVLKIVIEDEERVTEIKNMLSEEALEERFYRMLVRKGVLKRRRRKWVPLIVGLGILAAIVTGLLLSPIVTLVILFIVFVVLMRW